MQSPFASGVPIEGDHITAKSVGEPVALADGVAFLDGIQRFAVEGHLGVTPIVRGYVAAAVLRRQREQLSAVSHETEEFVVAPLARLQPDQRRMLDTIPLPLYDCSNGERAHPLVDVQLAAVSVEHRRDEIERRLASQYLRDAPDEWLVIDGAIGGVIAETSPPPKVIGVIKSHDTQFLEGNDLTTALTLSAGQRSSVFSRRVGQRGQVYTWYLRLWPWEDHDLLYGLVRIERAAADGVVAEATEVSRWLMAERAPLAAPDERWDRLLYPMRRVEAYLQARAGRWW